MSVHLLFKWCWIWKSEPSAPVAGNYGLRNGEEVRGERGRTLRIHGGFDAGEVHRADGDAGHESRYNRARPNRLLLHCSSSPCGISDLLNYFQFFFFLVSDWFIGWLCRTLGIPCTAEPRLRWLTSLDRLLFTRWGLRPPAFPSKLMFPIWPALLLG